MANISPYAMIHGMDQEQEQGRFIVAAEQGGTRAGAGNEREQEYQQSRIRAGAGIQN